MKKIVECIANFSEGRDRKKINLIAASIKKAKGVKVLNVDIDSDYNRTVISFVGGPKEMKMAAFLGIAKAAVLIDMSRHKGEHPRIGACDVCPFVPIQNVTMRECVRLARELGEEVGKKLKIPVYLYEEAAASPQRKNLASIRKGEYEGLPKKLKNPRWKPDYGPTDFNKKSGATVIGARFPLIAYNVNLKTRDKKIADKIAGLIRESGHLVTSESGRKVRRPGALKAVKAMGVFLKEYGLCQVSINLTNYKVTPPHIAFVAVQSASLTMGRIKVSGSEIVGLVPKEAILMAGKFYSPKEKSEEKLIRAAVKNLGLNSLKKFNPKKKIIEYMI